MPKLIAALGMGLALAALASAGTVYQFDCISFNQAADCAAGEAQLWMEVGLSTKPEHAGKVLITLYNSGPAESSISDVYFQDPRSILSTIQPLNHAGVQFNPNANPPELPWGDKLDPAFSSALTADSNQPARNKGVNPGENLGLLFTLSGTNSLEDVIAGLDARELRVGIHVLAFASGGSESFVNHVDDLASVPEPGSIALVLIGMAAIFAGRGRTLMASLRGVRSRRDAADPARE